MTIKNKAQLHYAKLVTISLGGNTELNLVLPHKDKIIDESELAGLPETTNTEIILSEPAKDIKAKKKLAKSQKKAYSNLLKANKERRLRDDLIKIVEK